MPVYFLYPPGGPVSGNEIIGPVRQNGNDVSLHLSDLGFPVSSDITTNMISVTRFPAILTEIYTVGYAAAGDGGAATMKRVSTPPAHGAWWQSLDGAYWELAVPVVKLAMLGAFGGDATTDAPAVVKAFRYQQTYNTPVEGQSGIFYKMANQRLTSDMFGPQITTQSSNSSTPFFLDFSDATVFSFSTRTRMEIIGTPDFTSTQPLLWNLTDNILLWGKTATYDSGTNLITFQTQTNHGFSTGDYIQIEILNTVATDQQPYLTQYPAAEARALSPPIQITVTAADTFTYPPTFPGPIAASLTSVTSAGVFPPNKYALVNNASAFPVGTLVALRAQNTIAPITGDPYKPETLRIVERVVNNQWIQLSEAVRNDMPYLVSNAATITPIPNAPNVSLKGLGIKMPPPILTAGAAYSAITCTYCRTVYSDRYQVQGDAFYGFATWACYETLHNRTTIFQDRTNEAGTVSGLTYLQYSLAYGSSCTRVKFIDCTVFGGRHAFVESTGATDFPYGATEDVDIVRPTCNDQVSSNIATHNRQLGRFNVTDAILNGGGGVNCRVGAANIHIKEARNVWRAADIYGNINNVKIVVDYFCNVNDSVVNLNPYSASSIINNVEIHVLGGTNARNIVTCLSQQNITGYVHIVKAIGANIISNPINFNGFSTSDTTVAIGCKLDYLNVDGYGPLATTCVNLTNAPNSSIGTVKVVRYDNVNFTVISLNGMQGDNFFISPDFQAVSLGGGTVTKVGVSVGTGHYGYGVVQNEVVVPTSGTITPRWISDHDILINSPGGTDALVVAGVPRGTHRLFANTGTYTINPGGNITLDGSTAKTITTSKCLLIDFRSTVIGFVQVAPQIT